MSSDPTTSEPLASFDPPLAAAVVTVLRRRGIPASAEPDVDGEVMVRVPAGSRDAAFSVVAAHMDHIFELAREQAAPAAPAEDAEELGDRPVLVFDVLRRYGVMLILVLAPLLVVTLSQPSMPLAFALVVVVGGAAAIVWWRERDER